jgi:CheY-like chemotaxis protein
MMIMRLRSFWLAKEQGFRVQLAPKCTEMRKRLAAKQIDLIVPDVMLLKGNELDLCRDLRSKRWNVPIMLLTAQGGRGSICAAARDQQHHPFAAEVRRLMLAVPYGRSFVCYSRPGPRDKMGEDFDGAGHLSRSVFEEVGVPREPDVYLGGPARFMTNMKEVLAALGMAPERVHMEIFNGSEPLTPRVVGAATRAPHLPKNDADIGPLVSFARSGIAVHWNPSAYRSILERPSRPAG